jgi:hypothetical protein
MSSVVRSVLGAALLLTSASAAMAQSYSTPVANNAPVASEPVQTEAPATVVAAVEAPVAVQSSRPRYAGLWCDNSDVYGGHGPNTLWGRRTFWDNQSSD